MQSLNEWMRFDTKMDRKDQAKKLKKNQPKNTNKMSLKNK